MEYTKMVQIEGRAEYWNAERYCNWGTRAAIAEVPVLYLESTHFVTFLLTTEGAAAM